MPFASALSANDSLQAVSQIALIVGVGIAVQLLASRARLPALLLLLATGLTLGPLTGVFDPDEALGSILHPLISVAVALVLFEGGLSLKVEEARRAGGVLGRLIGVGLLVGFASVAVLGATVGGLSLPTSAVLGAILVVTGPTVILPMLRQAKISMRPATLLKWEGIVNDPLGALLAVFVFQVTVADAGHQTELLPLIVGLILRALAAGAVGAASGLLLGRALRADLIGETMKGPAIFAAVLLVYVGAEHIGEENGLLAVTILGIVLGNVEDASIAEIRHFKEQIGVLLVSVLFIVLSARITMDEIGALLGAPLLIVIAVIFVVRPLVVALATWRTSLPRNERILVGWIAPRGVVAAAVAGAFQVRLTEVGYEDARLLVPIVFGVIVATVLLHGATIQHLARRLDLGARAGTGILIIGASNWALAMGEAITKAGGFVVIADTRYHRVSRARRRGMQAYYGDMLSEEAAYDLPFERISWVLAATDDDSYNALVCLGFSRELGRSTVLQLTPEPGEGRRASDHRLIGRTPWGDVGTYRALAGAYWAREQFKVTRLTDEFPFARLVERKAIVLFQIVDGRITPIDAGGSPPGSGANIVYLEAAAQVQNPEAG